MQPSLAPRRFDAFPPVVSLLLIVNGLAFIVQNVFPGLLEQAFALWPLGSPAFQMTPFGLQRVSDFAVWQLFTYAFLHGNTLHLFANMFALWMFGIQIENYWGSRAFGFYYVVCVVGAGLIQLVVSFGDGYPTLGASGGVFGILLAFGMMFPNQRILLLIPPIPLKAKWFVILYGAFELWAGLTGAASGVAHFAHLGGMLFGFLLIMYWRYRWRPSSD